MTRPAAPKPRPTRSASTTAAPAKARARPPANPRAKPRAAPGTDAGAAAELALAPVVAEASVPLLDQVASTLVSARRGDAQALGEAAKRSYAGVAAVLKRRLVILQETLSELRMVVKVMRQAGTRESVAHLDGLARGAMQLTLNSIRELSALASATQKEALDILARRLQADLAEFRQLRSKRSATTSK